MGALIRLLILIALVLIVWRLARNLFAPSRSPGDVPDAFEPTTRCAQCGTHVPREQLDASGKCPRCH
jgi:hypothetical protein